MTRFQVRKHAPTGVWTATVLQPRPGLAPAETTESFCSWADAMAAQDRMTRALVTREPWGPDVRGPASDRREVV